MAHMEKQQIHRKTDSKSMEKVKRKRKKHTSTLFKLHIITHLTK